MLKLVHSNYTGRFIKHQDGTCALHISDNQHDEIIEKVRAKSTREALRQFSFFIKSQQYRTEPSKPTIKCKYCGRIDLTTRNRKQGIMCSSCEEKCRLRQNRKSRRAANLRKIRHYILNRDNNRCQECSIYITGSDATLDHIDPNGPESPENIQLLCRSCNSSRAHTLRSAARWGHLRHCIGQYIIGRYAISQQEENEALIIAGTIISPYQI